MLKVDTFYTKFIAAVGGITDYGEVKDETAAGANDGSVAKAAMISNLIYMGYQVLAKAGNTPNNVQENLESAEATSSQFIDSLTLILSRAVANQDYYTVAGTADVITLTSITGNTPATAITNGFRARFIAASTNTTTVTINIDGIGAKTLNKNGFATPLVAGDIVAGQLYEIWANAGGTIFALINLSVSAPVGSYIDIAGTTPPTGYFEIDGAAISRTVYVVLFGEIGVEYGEGDGSTTYNLPDGRGLSSRNWDHGAGIDPDAGSISGQSANTNTSTSITNAPNISGYSARRYIGADITGTDIPADTKITAWSGTTITISKAATGTSAIADMAIDFDVIGSKQNDAMQGHYHDSIGMLDGAVPTGSTQDVPRITGSDSAILTAIRAPATDGTNGTPRITSETRPANMNQMRCIKY